MLAIDKRLKNFICEKNIYYVDIMNFYKYIDNFQKTDILLILEENINIIQFIEFISLSAVNLKVFVIYKKINYDLLKLIANEENFFYFSIDDNKKVTNKIKQIEKSSNNLYNNFVIPKNTFLYKEISIIERFFGFFVADKKGKIIFKNSLVKEVLGECNIFDLIKDFSLKSLLKDIKKNKGFLNKKYFLTNGKIINSFISYLKSNKEFLIIFNDETYFYNEINKEKKITKKILFKIINLIEQRSHETGEHVKNVIELSVLFAKLLNLNEENRKIIELFSPLHDIGKILIPLEILHKTGKLSEKEKQIMNSHAIKGYEILKDDEEFFKKGSLIAKEHHENWDGSGYPNGLKKEQISLLARIVKIIDTFDALKANRSYKKGWEKDKIINFFQEQSGKMFDPNLTKIFLKNIDIFYKHYVKDR